MNKTIPLPLVRHYVLLFFVLVLLTGFFNFFSVHHLRLLVALLTIPIGLLFSVRSPYCAVPAGALGIALAIFGGGQPLTHIVTGYILLFLSVMFIPLYFDYLSRRGAQESARRIDVMNQRIAELERGNGALIAESGHLEKEIARISQLYVLGRELVEHMEPQDIADELLRALLNRPGVTSAVILTREHNEWRALRGAHPEQTDRWTDHLRSLPACAVMDAPGEIARPTWATGQTVSFWPLRVDGDLIGGIVITADTCESARIGEDAAVFLPQIELALRRSRLFQEVLTRSRVDSLTGLLLRRYFNDRLATEIQRVKRYPSVFSVLMADIDHFKKVNDSYGHQAGDRVLAGVARIIQESLRPGDLACRYGGEEFVVLMPLSPPEETRAFADRILKSVAAREFVFEGHTFSVTISIGTALWPADAASEQDIIRSADRALYWVKTHGRNGCAAFSEIPADPT